MKYFIIAGEASGDLHASHLMHELRKEDPEAQFRVVGGDRMHSAGGELLYHYKHLAYMGFIPVLLHARTILQGLDRCKQEIAKWRPDAVVLVDYPGFNLKIARYVHDAGICPVYYYISPKIWAWKEHRIGSIRRDVDRLFSILPFEVDFFEQKHHYPISYVGNPTLDEVHAYQQAHPLAEKEKNGRIIAILSGSRLQEIQDNLCRMLQAAAPFAQDGYQLTICAAPAIEDEVYEAQIARSGVPREAVQVVRDATYHTLQRSTAALVTSGTATLETSLFGVPQVVCYYVACGRLVSFLRRMFLKVPYVSLVNLVAGEEVVPELVADGMTVKNVRQHLATILPGGQRRERMLEGYARMTQRLGLPGAPARAAREIVQLLHRR